MRILHLIDSLDYHASARQLQLLAPALAQLDTSVEVCCLGPETPWSAALREAGVTVYALGWTRWLDLGALWNLRQLLARFDPQAIHVWRVPALRVLAVVAREMLSRVVMSSPLPSKGELRWWDRRLLQKVGCVAVASIGDQESCQTQGVGQPTLHIVSPAVEQPTPISRLAHESPLRKIVCVGQLEREYGFRQAIWALDFVRLLLPNTRLSIVGAGSQLTGMKRLAEGLENAHHIEFLGPRADATTLLQDADVVWIPSEANCGRQVALEAMSLGRAVVAFNVPCLRELIRDGETGYLVAVGEVVPFARRASELLQDDSLRARIGAAARRHVEQQFPLAATLEHWRRVYHSVAA